MKSELVNLDFVLIANVFNPSIITKDWLISNSIFSENPINFLNNLNVSIFETNDYLFQITSSRLVLKSKMPSVDVLIPLKQKIEKFIDTLPQTPYKSVGFNVAYNIVKTKSDEQILLSIKNEFCNNLDKIKQFVGTDNFKFGFTVNFIKEKVEHTIQLIPIRTDDMALLGINFNKDIDSTISGENINSIKNITSSLNSLFDYSEKVSESLINKVTV